MLNVRYFNNNSIKSLDHSIKSNNKQDKIKKKFNKKNNISDRFHKQINTTVKLKDPQLATLIEKTTKNNVPKKNIGDDIKKESKPKAQ